MASIKGTKKNNTLTGTIVADNIFGFAGNDVLTGDAGNDKLYGGTGNDRLYGGTGNDRLEGGAGNDRLFGGKGTDTAAFSQASSNYTVTKSGTNLIVTGPDGQDTIAADVEILKFANTSIVIKAAVPVAGNDAAAGNEDTAIHTGNVLANDTTSINTLTGASITAFSQGAHGSVANNGDGTFTYTPVANYNGADSFTYTIDNGIGGKSTATVNVAVAPTNDAPVAVGDNGTASHGVPASSNVNLLTNDTDIDGNTLSVSQVNGSAANVGHAVATAQGGTVTVNADGSYTYNSAGVAAFDALPVGQNGFDSFTYQASDGHGGTSTATVNLTVAGVAKSFSLTTGADTDPTYTGTAGNDKYTGSISTDIPVLSTFFAGDSFDGGAGADSLSVTISGSSFGNAFNGTQITNIETVSLTNTEQTGPVTLNAALWSGVNKIVSNASDPFANTRITNLGATATAEIKNNSGGLVLNYAPGLLGGANDAQNLILSNSLGGSFAVADNTGGIAETLNITSQTAANKLTLSFFNDHSTINVGGGTHLTLDANSSTTLTTVNAAGMTGGGLQIDGIGATAATLNIAGSNFNDVFNFSNDTLDATDVINGSGGSNTIGFQNAVVADADFTLVSNIQTLTVDGFNDLFITGLNGLGAEALQAGINTISVFDGSRVAVNVDAGFTGPLTVNLDAFDANHLPAGDRADAVNGVAMAGKLTVAALSGHVNGDILTGGANIADTLVLTADSGATNLANVSGFEFINVLAGTPATSTANITTADSTVLGTGKLTVDATALLSSSAAFTFNGAAETDGGKFDITGGSGVNTLTGGTSDDVLTGGSNGDFLFGGDGNDTLTGNAGTDTLTAGLGADKLFGGANDDTFELGGNLTILDTIDGGSGTGDRLRSDFVASDATFTNVTNVEILELLSSGTTVLGAEAYNNGLGIKQVIARPGADTITIAAAYAGAITVDISEAGGPPFNGGIDSVTVAALSAATLTVLANAGDINGDTLTGGLGNGDTLILTADNGIADLVNVTNFETMTVLGGSPAAISITIDAVDTNVAAAAMLAVNAVALTSTTAFTFRGSAEADGFFNITGGAGNDFITGGSLADTINSGAGNDLINAGGGNDTINAGAGADTIVLLSNSSFNLVNAGITADLNLSANGLDTIDLGSDTSVDRVLFDLDVGQSGLPVISNFDAFGLGAGEDLFVAETGGTAWAAGIGLAGNEVRQSIGIAGDAKLVVLDNNPGGFISVAEAGAAADALQTGSADGETYLFAWNDTFGVTRISYGTVSDFAVSQDQVSDVAKLTGVTLAHINFTDFNFII